MCERIRPTPTTALLKRRAYKPHHIVQAHVLLCTCVKVFPFVAATENRRVQAEFRHIEVSISLDNITPKPVEIPSESKIGAFYTSAMSMLSLAFVRPKRHRLMMRINEDQEQFRVWNLISRRWELSNDTVFATESAAMVFSNTGSRVDISTHTGRPQSIWIADTTDNHVIGRVRIDENGRITCYDDMTQVIVDEIPELWYHFRDKMGSDEDIFRYKSGNKTWFVPAKYKTATSAYDTLCMPGLGAAPESIQPTRMVNQGEQSQYTSAASLIEPSTSNQAAEMVRAKIETTPANDSDDDDTE